ncbi:hypothetical protein B2J93_1593 [Marssonina coronariae]|uniref:HIRAN domain-containing protein n=1 Tax=Diplocarpon coronariae TaxID=2795749 RepID=A0A218YYA3_9HELO|nr:hypothetical protein B2J93_1593 [Marssonina coronariae]
MTWNPFLCTRGDPVQGHQRSNMGMSPDAVEVEGTTDEPTLDGAWNGSSVMITREPGNPYDSNAIRINNVHGTRTGHLPLESGEQAGAVFGCENHRAPRHHPPERADVLPRPDQSSPFLPSKDKSGVDSAGLSAATAVEDSRLHPARPAAAGTSRPADPIS